MGGTPRYRWILPIVVLVASIAPSCGSGTSATSPSPSSAVTFRTADGVRLAGRLFGPTNALQGVVLTHMLPADQTSWFPEATHLAAQGYRVLTFDLRGYCPGGVGGCSEGTKDVDAAPTDVTAALAYLRAHGSQRVALMGASVGGTASLIAASHDGSVPAVVTLSAPLAIGSLAVTPALLGALDAAKLFIAGLGDPTGAAQAAESLYDLSPQPKRLEIVTTDAHGTDLFASSQGTDVTLQIDQWFSLHLQGGTT